MPKPGWQQRHYLLPDTPQIINGREYLYSAAGKNKSQPMVKATKDQWQKLAEYVAHSPTMVLGWSLLFGSALLGVTNIPNTGFHLWSEEALDRLAFIAAVNSLNGGRNNTQLWNKSRSEIETVACDYNDFTLCCEYPVDDPKLTKKVPDVVSWLMSSENRLLFTLVDERSLSSGGQRGLKGLINLPLNCDPELGIFDSLPPLGCASSTDLSKSIIKLTRGRNYGWVFEAFTNGITAVLTGANPGRIRDAIRGEMNNFMRALNISDPAGQQFAAVFALAFAGAAMATRLKLLPWSRERIEAVIAHYYRMARGEELGPSIPERLEDEDIAQFRSRLREPTVLFLPWHGNKPGWTAEEAQKAEAFSRTEPKPAGYLVRGEVLIRWCGSRGKARLLISWLKEHGFLITEKHRPSVNTCQVQIHGIGTARYYVIDPSFLDPPKPESTSIVNP